MDHLSTGLKRVGERRIPGWGSSRGIPLLHAEVRSGRGCGLRGSPHGDFSVLKGRLHLDAVQWTINRETFLRGFSGLFILNTD